MARQKGTLRLGSNLEPQMNAPLDAREVVAEMTDLTEEGSFPYFYVGMSVWVRAAEKRYTLIGEDPTDIANWKADEGGSGGGGAEFETGLEVTEPVGGLKKGDTYAAGDKIEALLRDMLDPLKYPTLSNPSATLTVTSGQTLLESGTQSANITVKVNFNRGKIDPAYGTSGFRAGEATEYTVDGTTQTTDTFNLTFTPAKTSFSGSVTYGDGEQPKDSKGNNYDVPLQGDTVNTNTISAKYVSAFWSNVSDITSVAKMSLFDYGATKSKEYNFPAATVANPETFDIPAALNVTKIEVKSDLSGLFEDCSDEFTKTTTTHKNANDEDENYNRYTDNRGYNAGARTIRVTWA